MSLSNPYDDKAYMGLQGSQTPLAVQNQVGSQQAAPPPPKASGSPYDGILNHVLGQPTAQASGPAGNIGDDSGGPGTDGSGGPPAYGGPPPAPTTGTPVAPRGRPSAPPPVYDATHTPPKPSDADMADPEKAATWYRQFTYVNPVFANITGADVNAYRSNPMGMSIGDWFIAGHRAGETQQQPPPTDTTTTPPPTNNLPGGTSQGGINTGGGIAPMLPPGAGGPPAASAPTDWNSILQQLQGMMNPQFQFESNQLNRNMNAQAALTGDMNSGGYGEVSGRANAQLSADQGNRLSGMLNTDWQNALARELQKYGIDVGSADSRYTADRGVDAAGLHASAATTAAAMGLQGTMAGLGQQETESKRQWDEYWGNLGLGARGQDYGFLSSLLGGMSQYSPESLNQGVLGGGNFPGYSYFPGVDWTKYFSLGKP